MSIQTVRLPLGLSVYGNSNDRCLYCLWGEKKGKRFDLNMFRKGCLRKLTIQMQFSGLMESIDEKQFELCTFCGELLMALRFTYIT